jgi:hypothetical protein
VEPALTDTVLPGKPVASNLAGIGLTTDEHNQPGGGLWVLRAVPNWR